MRNGFGSTGTDRPPVLGVYLTTSESQDADVECFSANDLTMHLDNEIADCESFHLSSVFL